MEWSEMNIDELVQGANLIMKNISKYKTHPEVAQSMENKLVEIRDLLKKRGDQEQYARIDNFYKHYKGIEGL